jgi:hypothetical protein
VVAHRVDFECRLPERILKGFTIDGYTFSSGIPNQKTYQINFYLIMQSILFSVDLVNHPFL